MTFYSLYLVNHTQEVQQTFFGIFLLLGLYVKPRIALFVARFEHKFSESEL